MAINRTHRIREAIASPSVHNVQPARWHIDGESVLLLEDISRRLAVGDPTGHDAAISLGASAEGFALAASKRGLRAQVERAGGEHAGYLIVARIMLDEGGAPDPLADHLATRASWRGPFHAPSQKNLSLVSTQGPWRTRTTESCASTCAHQDSRGR